MLKLFVFLPDNSEFHSTPQLAGVKHLDLRSACRYAVARFVLRERSRAAEETPDARNERNSFCVFVIIIIIKTGFLNSLKQKKALLMIRCNLNKGQRTGNFDIESGSDSSDTDLAQTWSGEERRSSSHLE